LVAEAVPPPKQASLVRNTTYLTLASAATIPLAIVANALMGRYLGPEEFGYYYVAITMSTLALLAVEWGQQGALPALVSRDRPKAGSYLGASLVWRALVALAASAALALICELAGYGSMQKWAVALTFPFFVLGSSATAFKDTVRGFERTDIPALAQVAQLTLQLVVLVPVLLLGGKLRAVLLGNIAVAAVTVLCLTFVLRPVGVGKLRFERGSLKALFALGTPFVFVDLAIALLPNINAQFLAKLAPAHVIGWFGVSQRLIGLLIFPAGALIGALYPTLCRLHAENKDEFARVTRDALYAVGLLAVPAAVGCGLFAELGVAIFGLEKFAGAVPHLQVMSAFIFLVYFSMPLGSCALASNRQRPWAIAQGACILIAVCANPFLIPFFEKRTGNGALGTCVTLVLSEAFVVGCGVALAPRGVFNRELAKSLALAGLSGAAMAVVAWLTKPLSLFVAVPAAVSTYAAAAWLSGAVQPATAEKIKGIVRRKLLRRP
jgi:O-antigen/teichoic acid export membrane protein